MHEFGIIVDIGYVILFGILLYACVQRLNFLGRIGYRCSPAEFGCRQHRCQNDLDTICLCHLSHGNDVLKGAFFVVCASVFRYVIGGSIKDNQRGFQVYGIFAETE